jgi:hypothetical protein
MAAMGATLGGCGIKRNIAAITIIRKGLIRKEILNFRFLIFIQFTILRDCFAI